MHHVPGTRSPARPGMSLLEVQISALVAALVFAGLALTLSVFGTQVSWLQASAYFKGKVTPVGMVSIEPETIIPGESLAGKFNVDVRGLLDDSGAWVVTVERKAAASTDCGRQ